MIRITEKSLVEQMGLTDRKIAHRLHLFDFTDVDRARIGAAAPIIQEDLDQIIQDFYKAQLEDSEIAMIIGDIDTLKRLQNQMRAYITTLFKGDYNQEYANNRLRIGKVHKRLAVTPKLYISGTMVLQSYLDRSIEKGMEGEDVEATKSALHKILLFDSQMVLEAYIDGFLVEMETAREEVEKYADSLGIKVDSITRHMHEISAKDALTDLYNRRVFHDYLTRECGIAKRHKLPLTLMYLDLNGFKPVNDTHGHDVGDKVLRWVGDSINQITRAVDIPARYGGDEFCVILPRTDLEAARIPVNRLMEDFTERCEYPVTFSIGMVQTGPDEVEDASELIKMADHKMYEAKKRAKVDGKHHVEE